MDVFFIFCYFFLFVAFSEPASLYEESTNKDEVSFIIIVLEAVFVFLHIAYQQGAGFQNGM